MPNSQRSYRWTSELVSSLIGTICSGLPIGCILIRECGNSSQQFLPRPIEGVTLDEPVDPEYLILDGQQRMTSLYSVIRSSKPMKFITKTKRKIESSWYYIYMNKALDPYYEAEEAIVCLPLSKKKKSYLDPSQNIDCSTPEQEYESLMFPCNSMLNFAQWRSGFCRYWNYAPQKMELIEQFEREIVKKFEHYQVPSVCLNSQLSKTGVCKTFINVNTKGYPLNYFDLIKSMFDSRDFSLGQDCERRLSRLAKHKVLEQLRDTDFLSGIAFVSTHHRRFEVLKGAVSLSKKLPRIGGSRREIMELSVEEYRQYSPQLESGFEEAARFLYAQKIFSPEDLPYQIQLVVLGAIFAVVGSLDSHNRRKLERWFWTVVLTEYYSSWYEQRAAKDMAEVPHWLLYGGNLPTSFEESQFQPSRLLKITKRQGAFYKGMNALLRQNGAIDFYTGELLSDANYFAQPMQAHHIFPKAWCRKMKINSSRYNCLVNLTPLSEPTNRLIGGRAPADYLERLKEQGISHKQIDTILYSHLIEPDTLWNNDFDSFLNRRQIDLENMAKSASGVVK